MHFPALISYCYTAIKMGELALALGDWGSVIDQLLVAPSLEMFTKNTTGVWGFL